MGTDTGTGTEFATRCEGYLADRDRAVDHVRQYLAVRDDGRPLFTGSLFDGWAGGGDRAEVRDVLTADDLVAVSFLSMKLPGALQYELLRPEFAAAMSPALAALPHELDLWDATDAQIQAIRAARHLISDLDGAGFVTAFKLLARKRPRLVPVYDRVVEKALRSQHNFLEPLRDWTASADVRERLAGVAVEAGSPGLHPLRVFDIVVWMAERGGAPERASAAVEED